jgi:hypothetical protein
MGVVSLRIRGLGIVAGVVFLRLYYWGLFLWGV